VSPPAESDRMDTRQAAAIVAATVLVTITVVLAAILMVR
jgi:FlaG/FlaF family flagellin (archaellin)